MKLFILLVVISVAFGQRQRYKEKYPEYYNEPYYGPIAVPPGYDKYGAPLPIQDLPEVAAEKQEKINILASQGGAVNSPYTQGQGIMAYSASQHGYRPEDDLRYHGPIALPPGYDEHGAPLPVQDLPEVAAAKAAHLNILAHSNRPYVASQQDTPEVAAARAAHLASYKAVASGHYQG